MAVPGRGVAIIVDDVDLSKYLNQFKFERKAKDIDISHFGSKVNLYLSGPQDTTVTLNGFYDGGEDEVDEVFHRKFGAFGTAADINVMICPDTERYGQPAYMIPTTQITYDISTKVDGAVEIEGQFRANGAISRGTIIQQSNLVTASGDSDPIDNGAVGSSFFGAVGQLHVMSNTALPSMTVKLSHSDDDTTYAPFLTFDPVSTASGSQRMSTANNLEIKQFVKCEFTLPTTGSPAAVFTVGFARRTEVDID